MVIRINKYIDFVGGGLTCCCVGTKVPYPTYDTVTIDMGKQEDCARACCEKKTNSWGEFFKPTEGYSAKFLCQKSERQKEQIGAGFYCANIGSGQLK